MSGVYNGRHMPNEAPLSFEQQAALEERGVLPVAGANNGQEQLSMHEVRKLNWQEKRRVIVRFVRGRKPSELEVDDEIKKFGEALLEYQEMIANAFKSGSASDSVANMILTGALFKRLGWEEEVQRELDEVGFLCENLGMTEEESQQFFWDVLDQDS